MDEHCKIQSRPIRLYLLQVELVSNSESLPIAASGDTRRVSPPCGEPQLPHHNKITCQNQSGVKQKHLSCSVKLSVLFFALNEKMFF